MDVYTKTIWIADYIKSRDEIPGFNTLLKAIAKLFHKHNVPLERIDATLKVIEQYLHAEYNGYGDAFEKKGESK